MKLMKELGAGKYEVEITQKAQLTETQIDQKIAMLSAELAKWTALKAGVTAKAFAVVEEVKAE